MAVSQVATSRKRKSPHPTLQGAARMWHGPRYTTQRRRQRANLPAKKPRERQQPRRPGAPPTRALTWTIRRTKPT